MVVKKSDVLSHSGKKLGRAVTSRHPYVQQKIKKSLGLSVREGASSSVSFGLGRSYFSAFALAMNATASQVGILHAVIGLLPAIIQLKSYQLIAKFSRKSIVLWGVLFQSLIMIPMILTGALFFMGVPYMVWAFIICVGFYYATTAIDHPAWFSWMGSLVPEKERGRYFSRRNKIANLFGIVTMISGALILDGAKKIGGTYGEILGFTLLGFGILFILSSLARFYAWILFTRQYEPRLKVRKKDYFSFWQFLKGAPSNPFGKFALFRVVMTIALALSGPFWAVYMLRDLGFPYIWFMAISISGLLFQLVFYPLIGKFSDRFGNIKTIKTCIGVWFLVPLFWLASPLITNPLALKLYLFILPGMTSGFATAGYLLGSNNYVYDAVSSGKRGFAISYVSLMVGIGTFVGSGIGSIIVWVGVPFMNTLLFIFLLSAIARLVAFMVGSKYLTEIKKVQKCPPGEILTEMNPVDGITKEFHHLGHVVKKVEHYI